MHRFLPIFFLVFLGLSLSPFVFGQELALEHYRVGKEIPFSTIYGQIKQDEQAYLWMGTDQGLYRYDGQHFVHIPVGASVLDEEMLYIEFSSDGTLWANNLNRQVLLLSPGSDTLKLMEEQEPVDFSIKIVTHIIDQKIYFFSPFFELQEVKCGVINFHPEKEKTIEIQELNIDKDFTGLYLNNDVKFLMREHDEKNYDVAIETQGEIQQFLNLKLQQPLSVSPKMRYLEALDQFVLFTFRKRGIPMYLIDAQPPYHIQEIDLESLDFDIINWVTADRDQNIWVCTNNGFLGFDAQGQALMDGRLFLKGRTIHNVYQDIEGAYWVGTNKDGLYYIPRLDVLYFTMINSNLKSDNITALTYDTKGNLYGGTLAGELFQLKDQEFTTLYSFSKQEQGNSFIRRLVVDEDRILLALDYSGTHEFNVVNRQLTKKLELSGSVKSLDAYQGKVIGGHSRGVMFYDVEQFGDTLIEITEQRNTSVKIDRQADLLWMGEMNGLKYFDLQKKELIDLTEQQAELKTFVSDIAQDQDGMIWIASQGQGIFGLRPDSILFHLTTHDGLLSNHCNQLMLDEEQILWIGTNKGVNRLDLKTMDIQSIDRSNGLFIEEATDLCRIGPYLWVGTSDGLFRLLAKSDYHNESTPKIHFTEFRIWDREKPIKDNYELPYYDNNLYIGFQGIYYKNQEKMKYRYRMLGIDTMWHELDHRINFVRYPQIKPGTYQFELGAVGDAGLFSEPITMKIVIQSPLWERWWFRLLALLGLLVGIQLIVQSIQRRHRREEKYIRRIEQLRASALRSQMNPHFVFNTLNAILYFLLKNDRQTSIKYLSRFSKLIRSIFEHSKYDRVTLSEEIQFLENYLSLEHLRFSDRVTMQLHIDDHLRNSSISIPTLMVQPLLENAFKHGLFHKRDKGLLQFSIREELEGIVFEIEDNGIGRAESKLINQKRRKTKTHSSSAVIEERIQLINSKRPTEQPKISLTITDLKNDRGAALGTNCRLIFYY